MKPVAILLAALPFSPTVLAQAAAAAADAAPTMAEAGRTAKAGSAGPRNASEEDNRESAAQQSLPMTKEVAAGSALGQSQEGYSEAIKNQAGVQPTNSAGSSNDAFAIRGIKLNLFSNYRLDGGLPVAGVITNPTENKQRVETLKGANALMYGIASPAGIINFVTKRAGPQDVTTLGMAGNHFGQFGMNADIGRRFGEDRQFGVRINASATHLENGVRGTSGQGYFGSLGLDWRVSPKLTLDGDIEYYNREVGEQAGIGLQPAVKGVVPITRVPNPRQLLSGPWDVYTPRTFNSQARAIYRFDDQWRVLLQGGVSEAHRSRQTVRIRDYNPITGANGRVDVQPVTNDYRNTFYRGELIGHLDTGPLPHELTLGASSSKRYSHTYDVQNISLAQRQNIFDPIDLPAPVYTKPGVSNPAQSSTDRGLYAYDTVGITTRLKLLLGLRRVQDTEVTGSTQSRSYVTSTGYGALYDVLPTTTVFASYMEGLEAGGTAPSNAINANQTLSPAISQQREVGVRDTYFPGLSLNASYFEITRANALINPATNVYGYNGDLSYKGVEATARYELNRQWLLTGALLKLRARQIAPGQSFNGKTPENTPSLNTSLGVAYRMPSVPGLTLKAGVKYISERPVNPDNQGYIPSTAVYDAGLSYVTRFSGHRTTLALNIDNLFNKRYWNSVQSGTYGIGMDRRVSFSAKIDL